MYCSNCKKEISDNSAVCEFCGTAQGNVPTPQAVAKTPSQNNKSVLIIVIIALVAVLAFVIGKFAIAPIFSEEKETTTAPIVNNVEEEKTEENSDVSVEDLVLKEISTHIIDGRQFNYDMGENGLMQCAVGYDSETGIVAQVTASITITTSHPDYATAKNDFEATEAKVAAMNDSNIEFYLYDMGDSIKGYYVVKNLTASDRAKRIMFAVEELDMPYNEADYTMYIDKVADTFINQYEFVEFE